MITAQLCSGGAYQRQWGTMPEPVRTIAELVSSAQSQIGPSATIGMATRGALSPQSGLLRHGLASTFPLNCFFRGRHDTVLPCGARPCGGGCGRASRWPLHICGHRLSTPVLCRIVNLIRGVRDDLARLVDAPERSLGEMLRHQAERPQAANPRTPRSERVSSGATWARLVCSMSPGRGTANLVQKPAAFRSAESGQPV